MIAMELKELAWLAGVERWGDIQRHARHYSAASLLNYQLSFLAACYRRRAS